MTGSWVRPWSPGEPWPDDVLVLADSMEQAQRDLEERARYLWQRINRHRAEIRELTGPADDLWAGVVRRMVQRQRIQLRSVLRARRVVRRQVEWEQDRTDTAAKSHWLDGPLWERYEAGDR